jgi:hypothetical protein
MAALTFSFDTLKTGGHFLCKFYQGAEEKAFETKLKRLFTKVHREKPDSSRSVSCASWFMLCRRLIFSGIQGSVLCCLASERGPASSRRFPRVAINEPIESVFSCASIDQSILLNGLNASEH